MCFYFTSYDQITVQNDGISFYTHQLYMSVFSQNFFVVKIQYVVHACLVCPHYQSGGLNPFPQILQNLSSR